jgi:hypothetical protein
MVAAFLGCGWGKQISVAQTSQKLSYSMWALRLDTILSVFVLSLPSLIRSYAVVGSINAPMSAG